MDDLNFTGSLGCFACGRRLQFDEVRTHVCPAPSDARLRAQVRYEMEALRAYQSSEYPLDTPMALNGE